MVILIADDDRLVRFTIKSIIQELQGDVGDIFLEASNGRSMIQVCQERKPDIAFVDIQMPYVNGLDAIEESKKYSEHTEYVIVSGYSEFEYAQKGIRLGIHEYILKPIDENQLKPVLDNLKEKLEKQKEESNSRFQLRILNAFHDYATLGLDDMGQEPSGKSYRYLVYMLHIKTGRAARELSVEIQKRMLAELRRLGERVVSRKGYYAIAVTPEGTPCFIAGVDDALKGYVASHISGISRETVHDPGVVHWFQWFEADSVEDICRSCDRADEERYLGMQEPSGSVLAYGSLSVADDEREFLKLCSQLLDTWEQADGIASRDVMNTIWRTYGMKEPGVNLENVSAYCSVITGCRIQSGSLKHFCQSFVEQSEQMYGNVQREENDIIEQVKAYIQQYYMNDISISQLAEHFELTANYLSTVFHRKAGSRFIEYLTNIRIEAAKRLLLSNRSASVQDIALMVGYNSARHFSSLFQKQTGMTPSAYRKL